MSDTYDIYDTIVNRMIEAEAVGKISADALRVLDKHGPRLHHVTVCPQLWREAGLSGIEAVRVRAIESDPGVIVRPGIVLKGLYANFSTGEVTNG